MWQVSGLYLNIEKNDVLLKKIMFVLMFLTGYIILIYQYGIGNICQQGGSFLIASFVYLMNAYYLVFGKAAVLKHRTLERICCFLALFLVYPVIAFYIIEIAYNAELARMQSDKIVLNSILILCIEVGFIIAVWNYKYSLVLLTIAAWMFGLANHYLLQFRGSTLRPVELAAFKTALSVAGLYRFDLTDELVRSTLVMLILLSGIKVLPFRERPWTAKETVVRMSVGILCLMAFIVNAVTSSWDAILGIEIGHWSSYEVYAENGSVLSFILEGQEMRVDAPDEYSARKVEELLSAYEGRTEEKLPSVIVVMNETFADLSRLADFGTEDCLSNWYHEDCVMRGEAYVSVYGGGTCNSEYEFLTGNSMANFPDNNCPYTMYPFDHVFNLAKEFRSHDYTAIAVHPENKNNWNRSSVYAQMGVERFVSIDQMDHLTEVRGIVSDRSDYDWIIREYEEAQGPLFLFNITLQNHGGYENIDALGDIEPVHVGEEYEKYTDLITYLTIIRESDQAFRHLIDYFSGVEEPVILCMFGDHHPGGLNSELVDKIYGGKSENVAAIQRQYAVPYMIWANYTSETLPVNLSKDLSLNYLGANVLDLAGIRTPFTAYLLDLEKRLPVINAVGYQDERGTWHRLEEKNENVDEYQKVGYYMMFDR